MMQEELRFVHGGNVYEPTADGEPWLDFSANINPLGLSPRVKEALAAHLDGVIHYPDPAMRELRTALAAFYDRAPGDFILGNGAAELFYLYAFVTRPKRVLLPVPAFSEYERAAHAAGAAVSYSPLEEREDFEPDLIFLAEEARRVEADCIVLGNPNNPTGTLVEREAIADLAKISCRPAHSSSSTSPSSTSARMRRALPCAKSV